MKYLEIEEVAFYPFIDDKRELIRFLENNFIPFYPLFNREGELAEIRIYLSDLNDEKLNDLKNVINENNFYKDIKEISILIFY